MDVEPHWLIFEKDMKSEMRIEFTISERKNDIILIENVPWDVCHFASTYVIPT